MSRPRAAACVLLGLCVVGLSCLRPEPIVEHHIHALAPGALARVAIVPFYPVPKLERSDTPVAVNAAGAADLVSRFVSEALAARGVATVAPNDLVLAFEGAGQVLPRQDAKAAAQLAAQRFGATSVMLGRVKRYREREGEALGSQRPASVSFEVELYTAPAGERVFSARFDQTQHALSENVFMARQYPGGGTRWLTAGELARWGASHVVKALPKGSE